MTEVHAKIETKLDLKETDFISLTVDIEDNYKLPNVLKECMWNFVHTSDIEPLPPKNDITYLRPQKIKFFECNGNVYKRVNGDLLHYISRNGETKNMRLNEILVLNPDFPKEENLEITIQRKQTYNYTQYQYMTAHSEVFFGAFRHFFKKFDAAPDYKSKKKVMDEFTGI